MAKRQKTGEMTQPPSGDTPSERMRSSVANGDFDDILRDIAKALHKNEDINDLGKALGFELADIGRKIDENAKQGGNYMGTLDLLRMWRNRQTPLTEKAALRSVLIKAGFDNLADQYLSTPVLVEPDEMPDQVQRLREKLKARYIEEFSEVKVSPMDLGSRTGLQHIFVNLILMSRCKRGQEQPIGYDNLFSFIQTKTDKGFITRVAFLGEAGVGKSTLFAKIALDWAMGKCLQDITLLFHESFRDIEDSPFFGNIVMNHFPDDTEIKGEWIDGYIRENQNQRKVLILLDGLDEAKIDIKCPNSELAIVLMVRREKFIGTSVLISTRPFGADQIKSIPKIHEKYSYIQVKGFTKENTNKYIKQFFENDTASASSLIHFMNTNSVASQFMAPFPIFCSMLCYMWKEYKRETTEKLQTVSQLMKEMDFTLREQYSSRYTDNEEGYQSHMEKAAEAIVKVGCVAFESLLKNQLIFTKEEMDACDEAAAIACHVGILRKEKRAASRIMRQREGKQFIQEFCFPHKLLQEHTASLYIAWLYNHNHSQFSRILTHNLIKDYKTFRYVLYFTAAHGGEVGKSVLEALCKKVDDVKFIFEVAFECHDSEAIDPVRNLLKMKTDLRLDHRVPIATYLFTLETIGEEVVHVKKISTIHETLGVSESFKAKASSSYVAAVGLFTLQNLRRLAFEKVCMDDEFYTGMSAAASQSKIEKLTHDASCHYARGPSFLPAVLSLMELENVGISAEFFSEIFSESSKSKMEDRELTHSNAGLGSAASSHYARGLCSMPNLRSLALLSMKLDDEFYSTLASEASKSKIEKLRHEQADLSSAASSHYVRGLCSMPNLRSLILDSLTLSDEFYSTLASEASKSKIQTLSMVNVSMMPPSRLNSILALPCLQSLTLRNIGLVDLDDGETLTDQTFSVDELSVDCKHVTSLWNFGLHSSCPRVQKLLLNWSARENFSSDIVTMACSPFHHLTHLHIQGRLPPNKATTLNNPVSFCDAVKTCPRLTKLTLTYINLYNKKAAEIIQLLKTHPNLTSIELTECCINADLDPPISEVNSEGKLTVTVTNYPVPWEDTGKYYVIRDVKKQRINIVNTLEGDPHQTT